MIAKNNKKVIRDPIHKDIPLSHEEIKLVDTIDLQRLRNIKQTGLTCLVYPSANHTRFEHSLGTMYIAGEIADKLNADVGLTRITALLHDIGHPPFSHTLEICGYDHEQVAKAKIKKMEFENYSHKEIIDVLNKKGLEGKIISGDVDADRMDYLLRDSYHTGVAYGLIDLPRIMRSIVTYEEMGKLRIGILEKGIHAVESLLIARHQMYPTVYMHPTSRIADTMLKRAVMYALEDKLFSIKDLAYMDDIDLIYTLRNSEGEGNRLMKMIDERRLFKKIITYKYTDLTPKERWVLISMNEEDVRNLEKELSEYLGTSVFLDIPDYPKMEEHSVIIIIDDKKYRLDEVSPLAKSLKPSEIRLWDVGIYASPNKMREIKEKLDTYKRDLLKELIKDIPVESVLLDIIEEHEVIKGRGTFLSIAKEHGMTESEFFSELHKLVFCGLIKEKIEKIGVIYRYDYFLRDKSSDYN